MIMSLTVTIWSAVFSFVFVYVLLADDHVNYQSLPRVVGPTLSPISVNA